MYLNKVLMNLKKHVYYMYSKVNIEKNNLNTDLNILIAILLYQETVKPVQTSHSPKDQKLVLKTNYCLMQVKSIAECSKGSILQYFRPSFSYHLS